MKEPFRSLPVSEDDSDEKQAIMPVKQEKAALISNLACLLRCSTLRHQYIDFHVALILLPLIALTSHAQFRMHLKRLPGITVPRRSSRLGHISL